jgi:hypothetical protein
MPVRRHIAWGADNPLSDPRLGNLPTLVAGFRAGQVPHGWRGNRVWENRWHDLPPKRYGYYREFCTGTSETSGDLRIVLGQGGEVMCLATTTGIGGK